MATLNLEVVFVSAEDDEADENERLSVVIAGEDEEQEEKK